jgi:CheY-like chemotaxis protein
LAGARPAASGPRGAGAEPSALRLQFLASLNHEIRTPLSSLLGMTDLLLETPLSDEQHEYVKAARQCADGLFELLNDTLEYTALSAGTVQLDESEFHIEDTLRAALIEFGPKARTAGRALEASFDARLPRTAIGDAYRVRQMLGLLIQHAFRTSDEGEVRVEIGGHETADRHLALELTVRHPSGGMSPDSVRDVLEIFDEIEAGSTRRFNGIGLGLALTRRVVELLGGDFVIGQAPNGGGVLTAEIPVRLARPALVAPEVRNQTERGAPPRILIVDDNRISQQVLRAILAKGEYAFDSAADGPAALALAGERPYSLVLMDLNMPGMDGLETTERMRSLPGYGETPILALTAEVSDQVRVQCRQSGMAAFLNKPVHAAELLSTVNRFLA